MMEERQIDDLKTNLALSDTERASLVLARRGQGKFRDNVAQIETRCRVTEVDRPEHLIASHIKPWRYCDSAEERLAGGNGLLLTPTVDHLFDKGFISFDDNGELLVSPVADALSLEKMGILNREFRPQAFNGDQRHFLKYHRTDVFLQPELG